jgi:hypothetical protein
LSPKSRRDKPAKADYGISNYEFVLRNKSPQYDTVPESKPTHRRDFFSTDGTKLDEEAQMVDIDHIDDSRSMHAAHHISRDHPGRNDVWINIKQNK